VHARLQRSALDSIFEKRVRRPRFDVNVPDFLTEVLSITKDSKRFPDSAGWGFHPLPEAVRK
jgi:hypothetical protein